MAEAQWRIDVPAVLEQDLEDGYRLSFYGCHDYDGIDICALIE